VRLSDIGLRVKIMAGGLIPVILAAVLLAVILINFRSMSKSVLWVDHTHRIIRQTVETQADTMALLAWLRGFLLTGDERFMEEFKRREAKIDQEFSELKRVGADNATQAKALSQGQEILDGVRKRVQIGIAMRREISSGKDMHDLVNLLSETKSGGLGRFFSLTRTFIEGQRNDLDKMRTEAAASGTPQTSGSPTLMDHSLVSLQQAFEIRAAGLEMEANERGFLLTGKDESLASYEASSKQAFALLEKQKERAADNPGQAKLVAQIEDSLRAWIKDSAEPEIALRKQISASKKMRDLQAEVAGADTKGGLHKFDDALGSFKEMQENLLKEREKISEQSTETTQEVLVAGLAFIVFASMLISYFLAGYVAKPLAQAVDLAERIGSGDLSQTLETRGKDEVGRLAQALNQMVEYLKQQAGRTVEGINVLASSAAEISATVAQLATSTSKTSSAVAETTTTVEQVKQAARVSSDKAKKVAESAQQAVQTTEAGKKATDDTVHRMNLIKEQMESIGETVVRLSEHSQAIEEIIGTVQDLADQSNLLAVNASIEAARAGDQGKGFAVVAHEIKTLADQSKSATEQVRAILEETRKWVSAVVMAAEQGSKAVEAGVTQSVMAGESIQSLSQSVAASSQAASIIHTSTEQQFVGVDQVAAAMGNIDQAMQQNIAGTTQLESAAKRIEELGGSLREFVARYKM
jgi:methyl-accepting chemotaxis protein